MNLFVRLLADGTLVLIVAVSVAALLIGVRDRRRMYPQIIMAGLTSLFVAKTLSMLYQPSAVRPFIEHGVVAGAAFVPNPGFPSDHTLLAGVLTLAVVVATPYHRLKVIMVVLTLLLAVGRVLALVHTPLDVAAGISIGLLGGVWYITPRILQKK